MANNKEVNSLVDNNISDITGSEIVDQTKQNEEEPIYIMTIELEHGKNANIKIFLDSKPEELSFDFCKENNLDFPSMSYLSKQIKDLLDNFILDNKENNNNECIPEVDEEEAITNGVTQQDITLSPKRHAACSHISSSEAVSKAINTPSKVNKRNNSSQKGCRNHTLISSTASNQNKNKNKNKTETINLVKHNKSLSNKDTQKLCSYDNFFNSLKAKSTLNKSNSNKLAMTYSSSKNKANKRIINTMISLDDDDNEEKNMLNEITLINKSNQKEGKCITRTKKKNNLSCNGNKSNVGVSAQINQYNNTNTNDEEEGKPHENTIEKNQTISSTYTRIKKGACTNFGERLYEKGLKFKEISIQKLGMFKEQLKKEKELIYTFKPSINQNTDLLLKETKLVKSTDEAKILNYKSVIEKQFEALKQKHAPEVYPYKPKFNKRSLQIENKNKLTSLQRIDRLYHSKSKSKQRLALIENQMYEECSFAPQFTDYNAKSRSFVFCSFKDRMDHYRSQSNEKMNKLYEEVNTCKDQITGQELFRPHLCSKQGNWSREKNKDVHSSLYSYAAKYELNKSTYQDSIFKLEKNQREQKMSNNSGKILHQKKKDAFNKIFELIDSDDDNDITIVNMDLKKIPSTIIKIIQPIFNEMREMNQSLDKEEFNQACMNLYKILQKNDREALVSFPKTLKNRQSDNDKLNQKQFSFKPTIDKNSIRIVSNTYSLTDTLNFENELSSYNTSYLKKDYSSKSFG